MSVIVPTITAENMHVFREQMERVEAFSDHLHIDLMDGIFTKNQSVEIEKIWLDGTKINDLHLMFKNPEAKIDTLKVLAPRLVIVHAESDCDFSDFANKLHEIGILCGISVLSETTIESIAGDLEHVDHLLIFSGNLGYQGGSTADVELLEKIKQAKNINPSLEIAWDGGVNDENVKVIAKSGVDVINVGGYIHHSPNPEAAYTKLKDQITS